MKPKTKQEIIYMRQGGKILAEVLQAVKKHTVSGVTTAELDAVAAAEVKQRGAKAAFLGYQGFPGSICISINDEVVHGIPGKRVVQEGDLVGLDFGVIYHGLFTDGAITVPVGEVSEEAKRLLKCTQEALAAGIKRAKAGNRVGDISAAIQSRLEADNLGVIMDLSGHGVGHYIHEDPSVPNFGLAGTGPTLRAGMTLAIEPMATLGSLEVEVMDDGWTFVSQDHSLSAQFEHTILVTESGGKILTQG